MVYLKRVARTDLETLTKLDELGHAFLHVTLRQGLPFLREALLLARDKFSERRHDGVRSRLSMAH